MLTQSAVILLLLSVNRTSLNTAHILKGNEKMICWHKVTGLHLLQHRNKMLTAGGAQPHASKHGKRLARNNGTGSQQREHVQEVHQISILTSPVTFLCVHV